MSEEKLATRVAQIDARLAELELERENGRAKGHMAPRNLPLVEASDAVFVRRAYLDTIGRIPTADEARAFLVDQAADKRARLIDRLLADPAWKDQRFKQLTSPFRVKDRVLGVSQKPYIDWLRVAVEKDMPFDELVRTLFTAIGSLKTNPATGYLLRDHGWTTATITDAAWTFLGVDLVCANCHDHPFADWTQMQVYQLAGCFGATKITAGTDELWPASTARQRALRDTIPSSGARLEISDMPDGSLVLPSRYLYRDGKPGDRVRPDVLGFHQADPNNPVRARIQTGAGDGRSLRARHRQSNARPLRDALPANPST